MDELYQCILIIIADYYHSTKRRKREMESTTKVFKKK